ncbi:MAG: hypothetical protein L3J86_04730 [Thermoplasmata archaeon]|nr:hypothetical protein [Thermoplasmata archaeon]
MAESGLVPPNGPARKRETWSLKTLVQEISGRPIDEFQDPSRTPHPYVQFKKGPQIVRTSETRPVVTAVAPEAAEVDPVDRIYPPLAGATGRSLHGPEHEHHPATLAGLEAEPDLPSPGHRLHAPGPSHRPERIYLHYLLLHLDRLSDPSLSYLRHAVDEELHHRAQPPAPTPPPSPPS